ncbi:hypothetical protein OROMI_017415 [Orobanche minor]
MRLIEGDDFYQIRLPSNLVIQPGKEYIISSVKARCLSQRDALDEHFVINMGRCECLGCYLWPSESCQYPRVFKPDVDLGDLCRGRAVRNGGGMLTCACG